MQAIVDTHVHIYPFYNVESALGNLLANLNRDGENSLKIGCLTERFDCNLYQELSSEPRQSVSDQFDILPDDDSLLIRSRDGQGEFRLLPGQQIITAENIEILSLACAKRVAEGQRAEDTVRAILEHGGVPVVAWAPGKWFFGRGRVVRALLETFSPTEMLLGDTTLRPVGWLTPLIFRRAIKRGFRIIFGSDPLPFRGEEVTPGAYLTRITGPASSSIGSQGEARQIVKSLLTQQIKTEASGQRGSFFAVLNRLYRNKRAPKPAKLTGQ